MVVVTDRLYYYNDSTVRFLDYYNDSTVRFLVVLPQFSFDISYPYPMVFLFFSLPTYTTVTRAPSASGTQ